MPLVSLSRIAGARPSQLCYRAAPGESRGRASEGRISQRGAIAAPTHSVGWFPRISRTLSAVSNRRAITAGGRRGCGRERGRQAVQQADQPDALRRVTPLACASGAPRLVRGLSAPLARQPNGSEVLKATTPRSISHQAGFVRVPASVMVVPHRNPSAASTACVGPRLSRCPSLACRASLASGPRSCAIAPLQAYRESAPSRAVFRSAVPSQRRRIRSVGFHELVVHFPQSATVARTPRVPVAAAEGNVGAKLSNKPINPTPFAASRRLLAQAARRDSCAGYRQR